MQIGLRRRKTINYERQTETWGRKRRNSKSLLQNKKKKQIFNNNKAIGMMARKKKMNVSERKMCAYVCVSQTYWPEFRLTKYLLRFARQPFPQEPGVIAGGKRKKMVRKGRSFFFFFSRRSIASLLICFQRQGQSRFFSLLNKRMFKNKTKKNRQFLVDESLLDNHTSPMSR